MSKMRQPAGIPSGGQFAAVTHAESSISLSNDGASGRTRVDELYERAQDALADLRLAAESDPTFEGYQAAFEPHRGLYAELFADSAMQDECAEIGEVFSSAIRDELLLNEKPEQLGGLRVRVVTDGKDRTVEVKATPHQKADIEDLTAQAVAKLRLKTDYELRRDVQESATRAELCGTGSRAYPLANISEGTAALRYVEVRALPSLAEEFVKVHGGAPAIAEGCL